MEKYDWSISSGRKNMKPATTPFGATRLAISQMPVSQDVE
jgi:hypothetical protein